MESEQMVPGNTVSVALSDADHRSSIEAGLRCALADVPTPRPVRQVLYGLPCPRCRAYFDSELKACPCCKMSVDPQSAGW
jgi:hypothetical protein